MEFQKKITLQKLFFLISVVQSVSISTWLVTGDLTITSYYMHTHYWGKWAGWKFGTVKSIYSIDTTSIDSIKYQWKSTNMQTLLFFLLAQLEKSSLRSDALFKEFKRDIHLVQHLNHRVQKTYITHIAMSRLYISIYSWNLRVFNKSTLIWMAQYSKTSLMNCS